MEAIKKLKSYPPILYFWNEYRRYSGKRFLKKYTDIDAINYLYRKKVGEELNLKNPKRLTEKLQWLKLFYRNGLMPICSDKYEVRNYLHEQGFGFLLNELIGVYEKIEDIKFEQLPAQFVLKAAHGSGWNLICRSKENK